MRYPLLILMICFSFLIHTTVAQETPDPDPGQIHVPYIFGDGGILAMRARATIPITWNNPPSGAFLYLFIWQSHDDSVALMGLDIDPSDGVAIEWRVPEYLSGEIHGIAWFTDGHWIINFASGIEYASGKAPPEGICTADYSSMSGSPQVFDNIPNLGAYAIMGYLRDFTPVLEYFVDDVGFGWYKVDLSDPSVVSRLDSAPSELPDVGWIYALETRLHGDCTHLDN